MPVFYVYVHVCESVCVCLCVCECGCLCVGGGMCVHRAIIGLEQITVLPMRVLGQALLPTGFVALEKSFSVSLVSPSIK